MSWKAAILWFHFKASNQIMSTHLFETFEMDNQYIRRCPQRQPFNNFLLSITGRTMPGILRAKLLRLGIQLKKQKKKKEKKN